MPKDRNFRTNLPLLDNDPTTEIPDENEYKSQSRSQSPNRPQRRQPRSPRHDQDDGEDLGASRKQKTKQYQEKEMNWDKSKALKGKKANEPEQQGESQDRSPSKYQTNQSIKSHKSLAKSMNQSMMRSNASIKSVATTVNQERLA